MIKFYEDEYPQLLDIVIVVVDDLGETEAVVNVQGYNKMGWIQRKQLVKPSKKSRRKPLHKLVSIGDTFPAKVLTFENNGGMTLSRIEVSDDECADAMELWKREQRAMSIMNQISHQTDIELAELYREFGWALQDEFGYTMDGFESIRAHNVFPDYINTRYHTIIAKILERVFKPENVTVSSTFQAQSLLGVGHLSEILTSILENTNASIRTVAPPTYRIELKTDNTELAIQECTRILDLLTERSDNMIVALSKTFKSV